jgi:hypothetical protein
MRQKRVLAFILVLVLVGVIVVLSHVAGPGAQPKTSIPNSFATATSYDNSRLVLSNGRSFIAYNYQTGATALLSPDSLVSGLGGIVSLSASADKNYLLFQDPSAASQGVLYSQLVANGLDPGASYWWVYTVATQQFSPLPSSTQVARFGTASDTVDALSPSEDGAESTINVYDTRNLGILHSFNVPGSSTFYPVAGGYLLQLSDQKVVLTSDGVVNRVVSPGLTLIGSNGRGTVAVATSSQNKGASSLVLIDGSSGSTKVVADNLLGIPAIDGVGSTVLYSTGLVASHKYQQFHLLRLDSRAISSWQLEINNSLPNAFLTPVEGLPSGQAIVSDALGNYYLTGSGLAAIKAMPQTYVRSIASQGQYISLAYKPSTGKFNAILPDGSGSQQQTAVYSQLQSDGYKYPLLMVDFVVGTSGTGSP